MPCSVYQLLFKDPDCMKLALSDLQLGTYTNNKVKLIGACELYVLHSSTKYIEAVTFFMAFNEGSVLISCTTSLALGLIHPHASLDHLPPGSNIISSSANQPINDKSQLKVHMLMEKSKTSKLNTSAKKISAMCSNQEQYNTKEYYVNQCVKDVPVQDETRKWECQANVMEGDKKCQDTKFMPPVQPTNKKSCYMWSMSRPAKQQSDYKKKDQMKFNQVSMNDKNCQSNVCSDKNFQET